MMNKIIYWSLFAHAQWEMVIAATSEGLCFVGTQNKLAQWAKAKRPQYLLKEDGKRLKPFADEFVEYFQGELSNFTFPVDLQGTTFQCSVWDALQHIPYGQTCSYSDIAERLQKPTAVRAVAAAVGANPILITIPCHRVIGKTGSLTGYRGGLDMKKQLLILENKKLALAE